MAKSDSNPNNMTLQKVFETSFYRTFNFKSFTVEGYSRAPVMTFWRIPEYKLGFDIGWQPWEFMGTPRLFITHGHLDHILALPAYLARRRMMEMEKPTIYVPNDIIKEIRGLLLAYARLDQGYLECELIGVQPGDVLELSRELFVTVHKTYHTVASVGYIVWERRRKLKPEYTSLSGSEIRDLNQSGVEITYEVRFPRVAYLGDSSPRGLDANPDMYEAEVLIAEMTHISDPKHEEVRSRARHMSVEDYAVRRDKFHNQHIIAGHFSCRYSRREIETCVKRVLPDLLDGRLILS
ncbi:MAG: MBL fold metallo-hydrolase [Planctomycetia bacterium]|nr:MBL fold metallo-hydrolase [Planctomycetia bacterium]